MTAPRFARDNPTDEPFERFMFAMLEAYHDEHIQDGPKLSAYAARLLDKQRRPAMPEGADPPAHAQELVRQVDASDNRTEPASSLQRLLDALVVWPDCAEAYMWAANLIEGREHGILLMQPFYVLAIEALRRRLEPDGPFEADGITPRNLPELRMLAKSLTGLGEALATHSKSDEATARYIEAIRYDPEDTLDIRARLAVTLAVLNDIDSAEAAVERVRPNVFGLFARVVVAYCRTEGTGYARQALLDARKANPYVTMMITGQRRMLGMLTGDATFDEAQFVCLMLTPPLGGIPGLLEWVRRESGPPSTRPKGSKKRR